MIEAEQGEFIIKRNIVEKLGLPTMRAINSGNKELIKGKIGKFEEGGVVLSDKGKELAQQFFNPTTKEEDSGLNASQKINNLVNVLRKMPISPWTGNLGTRASVARGRKDGKFEQGGLVTNNTNIKRFQEGGNIDYTPPLVNVSNILTTPEAPTAASAQITINISGNIMSSDYVEGELAEQIKDAVRRGTDFGLS